MTTTPPPAHPDDDPRTRPPRDPLASDVLIDIETLPIDAAPGIDLAHGPPGWAGPVEREQRRRCPANITREVTRDTWMADERQRYALALAADVDRQRDEAVTAWRESVFRWATVRIGVIGVCLPTGPQLWDCETDGEAQGLRWLQRLIPQHGRVWTWGVYDPRILRARLTAHDLAWGPLTAKGKPWERRTADLQAVIAESWEGSSRSITGISVSAVAAYLGIERPEQVSGAGVLDAYLSGRWAAVLAHCHDDLRVEWQILRTLSTLGAL